MRAGGFSLCLLLFIIALCRAKDADKNNYETRSWMQDLKDHLYDRSLLELTIPGTHDSGAYEFTDAMSPLDPHLVDRLIKIANEFHLDIYQFIKNWSQTQDTTIYEQLMGGIRYLDLRACWIQGDWYTQHFLIGTRTQDLLNDINQFMSENKGELIVVELGELIPADQELGLIQMIQKTIGKWLAPRQDLNKTTLGEMIKKDHRIVLLYPPSNYSKHHDFLWDKTIYMEGSYANQDKLSAMQDWNVQEIKTQGGNGMIFELSWTLTTQDSETLKDFALEADSNLDAFSIQYSNFMLGNILLLDWWEFSNVVELTIDNNLRECNDDPKYSAVQPDGQFCRNFFENGSCNNPDRAKFMSEHCRLSCGFC